ncbi:MAG: RAD55 family ATPase [Telluria sp.]
MTDKVNLGRLPTGVPGLDVLLGGGLTEFSFNLITGAPGSGKTTLAHQIMFALAADNFRALFFTVIGEPPLKMLRYQQQFAYFDLAKVGNCIRYVNLAEDLRTGDFTGVLARIMREVEEFSPSLVFVDSFRSVVQSARGGNEGIQDLQQFVQELGTRMTSWQATTFLIGEYQHDDVQANPLMTVADGMISLGQVPEDSAVVRKVRIFKMRGQKHMAGWHTFRITQNGLQIFPRLLPPLADDRNPGVKVDVDPCRISLGVPSLDTMFEGGLPQGHSLLVSGPSGCGKTILSTQFLAEGVRQGEKGVAMFFEKGTSRLRNAKLAEMVQNGDVAVVESRSLDLSVEELLDEMLSAIERTGAKRVVIDSLSEMGLYLAPEYRDNIRTCTFRILASLAKLNVTVMLTVGLHDMYTELRFSVGDIAFLVDAILALRYVEVEGRLARVISVVKVRGSGHSTDLREFRITDKGVEVDSRATDAEGILTGRTTTFPGS